MKTKTINPLDTLSIQDLKELLNAIDNKFLKQTDDKGYVIKDFSKHLVKYNLFVNYIIENKIRIKQGDKTLNFTYGEMAIILIQAELRDRPFASSDNE
jgi:hypothetical protein